MSSRNPFQLNHGGNHLRQETYGHNSPASESTDMSAQNAHQMFHPQLELANQYLQESSYEKALQCFLRILQHDPRHDEAIRGVRFIMSRDTFAAQEKYRNIVNRLEKVIRGLTIHNGALEGQMYGEIVEEMQHARVQQAYIARPESLSPSNISTISTPGGGDGVYSMPQEHHQHPLYTNNFVNSPPQSPGVGWYRNSSGDEGSVPSPLSFGHPHSNGRPSMSSPLFSHPSNGNFYRGNMNTHHEHYNNGDQQYGDYYNNGSAPPLQRDRIQHPHSQSSFIRHSATQPQDAPPVRRTKRKISTTKTKKRSPSKTTRVRPKRAAKKSPNKRASSSQKKRHYLPAYMQDIPEMEQVFVQQQQRPSNTTKRRVSRTASASAITGTMRSQSPSATSGFNSAIKVCEMSDCDHPAIGNSDSHVVLYCTAQHKTMMHSECWHIYNRESAKNSTNQICCPLSWCQKTVVKVIMKLPQQDTMMDDMEVYGTGSSNGYSLDSARGSRSGSRPGSAHMSNARPGSARRQRPSSAPQRKSFLEDGDYVAQGSPSKMLRTGGSTRFLTSNGGRTSPTKGSRSPVRAQSPTDRPRSSSRKLVRKDNEINNLKSLIDGKEDQIQQLKQELNELRVSLKELPKKLSALQTLRIRSNSPRNIGSAHRDSLGVIHEDEIAAMLEAERRESVSSAANAQNGETPSQSENAAQSTAGVISVRITSRSNSVALPSSETHQGALLSPRDAAQRLTIDTEPSADSFGMLSPKDILTPDKKSPARTFDEEPAPEKRSPLVFDSVSAPQGGEFSPANIRKPEVPHRRDSAVEANAARKIQSLARGFLARKLATQRQLDQQFQHTQNTAAVLLQRSARTFLAKRRVQSVREQQNAAVTIQKNFRRYAAQRTAQQIRRVLQDNAATTIQLAFRRLQAQKDLARLEQAKRENDSARVLQHGMRAYIAQKKAADERKKLMALRDARATVIQREFRAYKARRDKIRQQLEREREEAERAESELYSHTEYSESDVQPEADTKLTEEEDEQLWEQEVLDALDADFDADQSEEEQNPANLESAALKIQTTFRGFKDRRRARYLAQNREAAFLAEEARELANSSAVLIQKNFRGFQTRREVESMRHERQSVAQQIDDGAASRLQEVDDGAARTIQRHFRGFQGRREVEQLRAQRAAAPQPEEFVAEQCEPSPQPQEMDFTVAHDSALTIQRHFRGFQDRKRFQQVQHVHEQELHRQQENERQHFSAVAIQKSFRGFRDRREVEQLRAQRAASLIAAQPEDGEEEEVPVPQPSIDPEVSQRSALTIQRHFRGFQDRKHVQQIQQEYNDELLRHEENEKQHFSALAIQSSFRGYKGRHEVEQLRAQRVVPTSAAPEPLDDESAAAAALKIQNAARVFLSKRRTQTQRENFNVEMDRIIAEENSKAAHDGAVTIQRHFRGFQDRKSVDEFRAQRSLEEQQMQETQQDSLSQEEKLEATTLLLQKYVRAFLARRRVNSRRRARWLEDSREMAEELHAYESKSAFVLQRCARRFLALIRVRKVRADQLSALEELERRELSAQVIQRLYRGHRERSHVDELRRERATARVDVDNDVDSSPANAEEKSAIVIQKSFRGFKDRKHFEELRRASEVASTETPQDAQTHSAADEATLNKAALVIQRQFRRCRAVDVVEALRENHQKELDWLVQQETAASTIQKVFRFFTSRRMREMMAEVEAQ